MCNLYRMTKGAAEVARLFGAEAAPGANFAAEVYPGYPGLVVARSEGGGLVTRTMTWGFPLAMKGKGGRVLKPKPVTNAREDKLSTSFWRPSLAARRCLVPVSAWAEAEGEKGRMTRTWYALPEAASSHSSLRAQDGDYLFAVAGLWRPTAEWGDAYAMVMCDGCETMADVHDRMPVILEREHWEHWLSGSPDEAIEMCRTWPHELLVEKTREKWAGGAEIAEGGDCQPDLL